MTTSELRIEADDPDAGDAVFIAIWPGPIYETDREGALKIGLELLDTALAPEGGLVELRVIEREFLPDKSATLEELRKFIRHPLAFGTTYGRSKQLALKILRAYVVVEKERCRRKKVCV